jgi:pyridoxamine 5'-phosphate oxidase
MDEPLEQFRRWHAEAGDDGRMALATATPDGAPSVRMVLLKGAGEDGFLFFTGYGSRKGAELEANPRAALLFYWDGLGRQVRVEGTVERVSDAESDAYFATRPRGAQIAATVSRQGRILASRQELDDAVAERERAGGEIPRPEH